MNTDGIDPLVRTHEIHLFEVDAQLNRSTDSNRLGPRNTLNTRNSEFVSVSSVCSVGSQNIHALYDLV
jgi:hypothetical protein